MVLDNYYLNHLHQLQVFLLRRKVEEVITNYGSRVRLDQVIVTESPDRNAIEVRVVFYCMNIANPVTVLTTLQRIR